MLVHVTLNSQAMHDSGAWIPLNGIGRTIFCAWRRVVEVSLTSALLMLMYLTANAKGFGEGACAVASELQDSNRSTTPMRPCAMPHVVSRRPWDMLKFRFRVYVHYALQSTFGYPPASAPWNVALRRKAVLPSSEKALK